MKKGKYLSLERTSGGSSVFRDAPGFREDKMQIESFIEVKGVGMISSKGFAIELFLCYCCHHIFRVVLSANSYYFYFNTTSYVNFKIFIQCN